MFKRNGFSPPRKLSKTNSTSFAGIFTPEKSFFIADEEASREDVENIVNTKLLAEDLYHKKQYLLAIESYNKCIQFDPQDVISLSNRAACYMMLKNYELCIIDCHTALDIKRNFPRAYYRIGKCFLVFGLFDEANSWFLSGLEVCLREDESIRSDLERSLELSNQLNMKMEYIRNNLKRKPIEVMDLIEKVLEIIPNCRNINTLKISCLLNMQREKEVLDIFERIYPRVFTQPFYQESLLFPDWTIPYKKAIQMDTKLLLYYVKALMIDNQLNNALYLLEKLPYCERYNGKIEKCFIKLKNMIKYKDEGFNAYERGMFDCCISFYTQALRCAEESCYIYISIIYSNRSIAYIKLKRFEEAIHDCDCAIKRNHKLEKPYIYKSKALHFLGKTEECVEVMRKLVQMSSNKKYIDLLHKYEDENIRENKYTTPKFNENEKKKTFSSDKKINYMQNVNNTYLYKILGLSRDATYIQIRKQFRQLALKYHPDKNPSAEAAERMIKIIKAYEVLRDENRREKYLKTGIYE